MSSLTVWPGCATLTFMVVIPYSTTALKVKFAACTSSTAGMIALIGITPLINSGKSPKACSNAPANQRPDSSSLYSANGENSAQPPLPAKTKPCLTSIDLNFIFSGRANAFASRAKFSIDILSYFSLKDV